jgi:hypothetical protein
MAVTVLAHPSMFPSITIRSSVFTNSTGRSGAASSSLMVCAMLEVASLLSATRSKLLNSHCLPSYCSASLFRTARLVSSGSALGSPPSSKASGATAITRSRMNVTLRLS